MNQKEAVELAIMKTEVKNISEKLDMHIKADKESNTANIKAQKEIMNKLDEHMKAITKVLETKADKNEVEKIHIRVDAINSKIYRWGGAIAAILTILTLVVTNLDKIFGRIR